MADRRFHRMNRTRGSVKDPMMPQTSYARSRNDVGSVRTDVSCVDLFCGAGGLTYGFAREGLRVNAGIDLDPACRHPYSANNDATFIQRDISDMAVSEIAELFTPRTIWVLAGCAPCQPFSTYSQRYDTRADHKWGLLYEFERIAAGVMPDIVTMENVPAIKRHKVFGDFVAALKHLGYEVWHDVVDCAAYGVPQSRKRMVLLASLHGPINLIEPPRRTSCTSPRRSPTRTWPACGLPNLGEHGETGRVIWWRIATGSIRGEPIPASMGAWNGKSPRRRLRLNATVSATDASAIRSRTGPSRYAKPPSSRVFRKATSSSRLAKRFISSSLAV